MSRGHVASYDSAMRKRRSPRLDQPLPIKVYQRSSFESFTPPEGKIGGQSTVLSLNPDFRYLPLSKTSPQMRLLRLLPPRWPMDSIRCELCTVDLDLTGKYEALSYEWGSSELKHIIKLDNQKFVVGDNLNSALKHLRPSVLSRMLWVDALCINQDDLLERGTQVAMMGRIYSQAQQVVAWIGNEDDQNLEEAGEFNCKDAIDYLRFLSHQDDVTIKKYNEKLKSRRKWPKTRRYDEKPIVDPFLKEQLRQEQKFYAVVSIACRTYWTRVWIVQEVMLAAKVMVQCGSVKFALETLLTGGHAMNERFQDHVKVLEEAPAMILARMYRDRSTSSLDINESLEQIVSKFSGSRCGDIRDKVFGILSMAPLCCQKAIKVDYTKMPLDVCQEVLIHSIFDHAREPHSTTRLVLNSVGIGKFHGNGNEREVQARILEDILMQMSIRGVSRMNLAYDTRLTYSAVPQMGRISWICTPRLSHRKEKQLEVDSKPGADEHAIRPLSQAINWLETWRNKSDQKATEIIDHLKELGKNQRVCNIQNTASCILIGTKAGEFFRFGSDFPFIWKDSRSYVEFYTEPISHVPSRETRKFSIGEKILENKQGDKHNPRFEKLHDIQLSIFLTSAGEAGFCTKGSKVGDLVCDISGSKKGEDRKVAIVNTTGPAGKVIGKGLLKQSETKKGTAQNSSVIMHLDMPTLLYLNGYF